MQSSAARNEISLLGAQQSDSTGVFLPSQHHHTLVFSLSLHLSEHFLPTKGQLPSNQKHHTCTKPRSISRRTKTTKATPACSEPLSEMSSRSDVDLMPWTCVGWAQSTLLAFTGVVNSHRTLAQGKGKHRNWNKACSQSALGSQPLFYSEVLKLVKLIHHKLCVYKVKCPGKWDCSANNAVLDGAVKGRNSRWDDYVSQLLRWITKFTFQYLVILGDFSLGMKPTDRNILFLKRWLSYLWTPCLVSKFTINLFFKCILLYFCTSSQKQLPKRSRRKDAHTENTAILTCVPISVIKLIWYNKEELSMIPLTEAVIVHQSGTFKQILEQHKTNPNAIFPWDQEKKGLSMAPGAHIGTTVIQKDQPQGLLQPA